MKVPYIPKEILHIILEYNGTIKYKNGKYVNIINKNDIRYNIINQIIIKKIKIIKNIDFDGLSFYFQFCFDKCNNVGLCYHYNFSYENRFEICYYDTRNGWLQIRTYL
jgi:hypothetical protein